MKAEPPVSTSAAALADLVALAPSSADCAVVELRQYALHPGRRDDLIALFEREFVETQEAVGMRVLGQFRDAGDADRFVWLRGFADMASRRHGLEAFYSGPVWAAHADAANAAMRAWDDVRLLRPAWDGAALRTAPGPRTPAGNRSGGSVGGANGVLDATIFPLHAPADAALIDFCRDHMQPAIARGGAISQGWYVTEPAPNDFLRLPVREGEPVLAGFALFPDAVTFDAFLASRTWARGVAPGLSRWLAGSALSLRLLPTARSALHA